MKKPKREELEEKIRRLDREKQELEAQLAEYQCMAEITLKEYFDGLYTRTDEFKNESFIVTEALLKDFRFGKDLFVVPSLYMGIEDSEGRAKTFKFHYADLLMGRQPEEEQILSELLEPLVGKKSSFIVYSNSKAAFFPGFFYFSEGIVKEGEKIYFKDEIA